MTTTSAEPAKFYKGYGAQVAQFMEQYVVQTKGRWAREPLTLEAWEKDLLDELYLVDGRQRLVYREALVGLARKNGKSTLGSGIALHGLVAAGEEAPEVYAAAGALEQARIVFGQARKMVEVSPKLQDWLRVYRNVIECKANGGIFRVLTADGPLQHGLNPSTVVIDELWAHRNPELYYALTTGQMARENPLVVTITTAGWDRESICWQVFQHGEALAAQGLDAMRRERFLHRWYAAPPKAKVSDRDGWRRANPSSWIGMDDLAREQRRLPENVFRRLHMNQWTEIEDAWITPGTYDACVGRPLIDPQRQAWIATDVGLKRDSTAIITVQWESDAEDAKLQVKQRIAVPKPGRPLGVADVRQMVANEAIAMPGVQGMPYDPWSFRESAELLLERGLPMVEWPQNNTRMCPASQTVYELFQDGRIVVDGDEELRRQVLAAVSMETDRGWRISKRKSLERIDAAIALAMAADLAVEDRRPPPKHRTVIY